MKNKLLLFLFILGATISTFAQSPIVDTNPASVKWQRMITPYFYVIFPKGFEEEAQRTANTLETIYEPGALSLGEYPKRTPVILQNKNTVSNGFVAWTPYRSEFNTFPSPDYRFLGNNDWMELLSFHEYRHMVQINKSKTGFTKGINILFGQATTAALADFAAPDWFWEGDATIVETAYTPSGRGRIPRFNMVMRSNLLEKGSFTYNKQHLGSFKDNVPNEYVTGYFFTGYLREKYGAGIMDKVTQHAWNWSFVPFTYSNSLKKYTDKYLIKNYKEFISHQESVWKKQMQKLKVGDYSKIQKRKNKIFTNYSYPHVMSNGDILTLKEGLGDIATFIKISPEGVEQKIVIPGFIQPSGRISFNGNQIVWEEITPDIRWGARNYSDIKIYDMSSGKIRKVTKHGRYASSAISKDGEKIVSVHNDEQGRNSIVSIDLNGKIIHRYKDLENAYFQTPGWTENDQILVVKVLERRKSVIQIDPEKGEEKVIFEAGYENISYPKKYGDLLFYQSSYNGIDNIYLFHLKNEKHYQVTNAKYGAYYPFFDETSNKLYFSDQGEYGLNVTSIPFNPDNLEEKPNIEISKDPLAEILTDQESGIISPDEITDHQFPIEEYQFYKGVINPHSWGVTLSSLDNEYLFFVNSRDIRSTTLISAGYAHNFNENVGSWQANISYQGLFPVLDLNVFDGERRLTEEFLDTARGFRWDEKGVEFGLRVPLNFTRSKYFLGALLGAQAGYIRVNNYGYPYEQRFFVSDGNLQSLKLDAQFSRLLKRSKRDIYGKWGQILRVFLYSTPFLGDYQSTLFATQATAFFPGLFKHHSFFLNVGYQYEDKWNYTFSSPISFPRGYTYSSFDNFYMASANYTLPVLYPDLGVGPFLYVQRIRSNLYYDFGRGIREHPSPVISKDEYYNSMGIEINFDFNIMRFKTLLDVGFRINYLPEEEDLSYNLIIGNLGF